MTGIGTEFCAAESFNEFEKGSRDRAMVSVAQAFRRAAAQQGLRFGDISFHEGVHQEQGPMIVGEARVTWIETPSMKIVDDLEFGDLQTLRAVTRRVHQKHNPGAPEMTDQQCDIVIDEIAPEMIENMLHQAVSKGQVH